MIKEKMLSELDTMPPVTGGYCLNKLYNVDCMEAMKHIPDKFFQLAITD